LLVVLVAGHPLNSIGSGLKTGDASFLPSLRRTGEG
jgi:hypothetical protein